MRVRPASATLHTSIQLRGCPALQDAICPLCFTPPSVPPSPLLPLQGCTVCAPNTGGQVCQKCRDTWTLSADGKQCIEPCAVPNCSACMPFSGGKACATCADGYVRARDPQCKPVCYVTVSAGGAQPVGKRVQRGCIHVCG